MKYLPGIIWIIYTIISITEYIYGNFVLLEYIAVSAFLLLCQIFFINMGEL